MNNIINRIIKFPCPKCKIGYITDRIQTDLSTDKINLSYECYNCGYKLKDYIRGK